MYLHTLIQAYICTHVYAYTNIHTIKKMFIRTYHLFSSLILSFTLYTYKESCSHRYKYTDTRFPVFFNCVLCPFVDKPSIEIV